MDSLLLLSGPTNTLRLTQDEAFTVFMQYLWNTQEAKLLRQKGQIGETNAALDRLVNGTVSKVYLSLVKLQV